MNPSKAAHPRESMLDYLENRLSQDQKTAMEAHLMECQDCKDYLREIAVITSALRDHRREVFCPDPMETLHYAQTGDGATGRISEHLETCGECSEEVKIHKRSHAGEVMSPRVHQAFQDLALGRAKEIPQRRTLLSILLDRFRTVRTVPVMALGAAAAVVILVILMFPGGGVEPMIGLSSVQWAPRAVMGRPLVDGTKPKIAVVIIFKGFSDPVSQETVDSLYRALDPTWSMKTQFDFLNPSRVKESLAGARIKTNDTAALLDRLRNDLQATQALLLTVNAIADSFTVEAELVDASTGKTLEKTREKEVRSADLTAKLKQAWVRLMSGDD